MQDNTNLVLTIVVSLLILGVGLFVIVVFTTEGGIESSSKEYFSVDDPSVDQHVTLKYIPSTTPTVSQYNGIEWVAVSSTYVSYSGTSLTVAAGGLQG